MAPNPLGRTKGGQDWKQFMVGGLNAFIVVALYIEMKRQFNYKIHWMKNSLFHCSKISSIMSRAQFIYLRRCLYLTNSKGERHVEKGALGFDKLHQIKWLLNDTRD